MGLSLFRVPLWFWFFFQGKPARKPKSIFAGEAVILLFWSMPKASRQMTGDGVPPKRRAAHHANQAKQCVRALKRGAGSAARGLGGDRHRCLLGGWAVADQGGDRQAGSSVPPWSPVVSFWFHLGEL